MLEVVELNEQFEIKKLYKLEDVEMIKPTEHKKEIKIQKRYSMALGKVEKIYFGQGGYQDACIGVSFLLSGPEGSCWDFWGAWALEPSKDANWTDASRKVQLGEMVMKISKLLEISKVNQIEQLKGKPVEMTMNEEKKLVSWRILTEVL